MTTQERRFFQKHITDLITMQEHMLETLIALRYMLEEEGQKAGTKKPPIA